MQVPAYFSTKSFHGVTAIAFAELVEEQLRQHQRLDKTDVASLQNIVFRNQLLVELSQLFTFTSEAIGEECQHQSDTEPLWMVVDSRLESRNRAEINLLARRGPNDTGLDEANFVTSEAWQEFWTYFRQLLTEAPDPKDEKAPQQADTVLDRIRRAGAAIEAKRRAFTRSSIPEEQVVEQPNTTTDAPVELNDPEITEDESDSDGVEDLEDFTNRRRTKNRIQLGYRGTAARMALNTAKGSVPVQQKRRLHCFRGLDEFKRHQEILRSLPKAIPTSKFSSPSSPSSPRQPGEVKRSGRKGLSLNRMPELPPEGLQELPNSSPGNIAKVINVVMPLSARISQQRNCAKVRLAREEALKQAEPIQVINTFAQMPQCKWNNVMFELMAAEDWRQRASPLTAKSRIGLHERLQPRVESPQQVFHRPWSRQEGAAKWKDKVDGYLSPMQRFAKVCLAGGLRPHPSSVQFLASLPPALDIRGKSYGDEDLMALAIAMPVKGGLEAADLGDNPLITDASACILLEALSASHKKFIASLRLDGCSRLGRDTISLLYSSLLRWSLTSLRLLDLSGISISSKDYMELARTIQRHPQLRELRLVKTGLGLDSVTTVKVIHCILSTQMESLDLGYNCLNSEAFATLGQVMRSCSNLKSLGLASTASTQRVGTGASPMLLFLEDLAGDEKLTSLDISQNALNDTAAFMLECAFSKHLHIEHLDVSRNSIGIDGIRSLLRLLADVRCPGLRSIIVEECRGEPVNFSMGLFDVDPSGRYALDLSDPSCRSLFRLLLARLAHLKAPFNLASYFQGAALEKDGEEQQFSISNIKSKFGSFHVPTSGFLHFELRLGQFFLYLEDAQGTQSDVVRHMLQKTLRTLDERKALSVLCHLKSLDHHDSYPWLQALCQDFLLTPQQLASLCHTTSKRSNCAQDPPTTFCMLFACLLSTSTIGEVATSIPLGDVMRIEQTCKNLLSMSLENPTGRYMLNLSHPSDRSLVQQLLLLSRWEAHLWAKSGLIELSQNSNGRSFRNVLLEEQACNWTPQEWRVPTNGDFQFDFVSLRRPSLGVNAISDELWCRILRPIRRCLGSLKSMVMGTKLKAIDVLWALRGISASLWLSSNQLRRLLCAFKEPEHRMTALIMFSLRCVDWPLNGKLCWSKFSQADRLDLQHRLGYLNFFPYFQPESTVHCLDLAQTEQRRLTNILVKMAFAEVSASLRQLRVDWSGSCSNGDGQEPHWEAFATGIPMTWDNLDAIAHKGLVETWYSSTAETARPRVRRRFASQFGGWTALPDDVSALNAALNVWQILDLVPTEVVQVTIFMFKKIGSLDKAFALMESSADKKLNQRKFSACVTKVKNMKCVSDSPSEEHDDFENVSEQFSVAFRFLDPFLAGEVSKKQLESLNGVWKELLQSMWEFKGSLEMQFGSIEQAFCSINGPTYLMQFNEFCDFAEEVHPRLPLRAIFLYLDDNNNEQLSLTEWVQLDCLESAPLFHETEAC